MSTAQADIVAPMMRRTLEMFDEALSRCPDALWADRSEAVPFWLEAYHTIVGAAIWLQTPEAPFAFPPFHAPEADELGPVSSPPIARADVAGLWQQTRRTIEAQLEGLTDAGLMAEATIFNYRSPLLARLLGQIRHIQHHTGCLAATLRRRAGIRIAWPGL